MDGLSFDLSSVCLVIEVIGILLYFLRSRGIFLQELALSLQFVISIPK